MVIPTPSNLDFQQCLQDSFDEETGSLRISQTRNAMWFVKPLLNGVSQEMNVNGAVTPVEFTSSFVEDKIFLKEIGFFILDNGTTTPSEFGNITALSNGLKIEIKSQGNIYQFQNLKDNMDIVNTFTTNPILPGTASGFLNNNDLYSGSFIFDIPIVLSSSTNDYIKFIVRDDLTQIDFLRTVIKYRTNI